MNTATLANGTAMRASLTAAAKTSDMTIPAGHFGFADFAEGAGVDWSMLQLAVASLEGAGIDDTTLELELASSTRGPLGDSARLYLVRTTPHIAFHGGGFTVKGSPQHHLFGGVEFYMPTAGGELHDLRVTGWEGDDNEPPGEKFGVSAYEAVGVESNPVKMTRVRANGQGRGSSPIALNGCQWMVLDHVAARNSSEGTFTTWASADITYLDVVSANNGGNAYNNEESDRLTYVRPRADATNGRWNKPMTAQSQKSDRAITVVDPRDLDGNQLQIFDWLVSPDYADGKDYSNQKVTGQHLRVVESDGVTPWSRDRVKGLPQ